ncbi:hypothetical protein ACA910_012691 [Epithemia clementina (nom. ined.)]
MKLTPSLWRLACLLHLLAATTTTTATSGAATTTTENRRDEVILSSQGEAAVLTDEKPSPQPFVPALKSLLTIQVPHKLYKKNGEGHALSRFGVLKSRGSMSRYVYYTEDNLCQDPGLYNANDNSTFPNITKHGNGFIHPFFLLAKDRPNQECTAVRMARNAQEYGASALILGEAYCRCQDDECTTQYKEEKHCLDSDPPLVDDGSASDVTIPTVMLHKQAAEHLYKVLKDDDESVMIEFTWGLPLSDEDIPKDHKDDNDLTQLFEPHYHLWSSAHDPLFSTTGYKHLRILAKAFGPAIHFSPRFYLQNGTFFGCTEYTDEKDKDSPCFQLCTNKGHYCTSHAGEITGKAIIIESLRRLCIYRHYPPFPETTKAPPSSQAINTAYWDYVIYHLDHCSSNHTKYSDEKCIEEAYKAANVEKDTVESCMKDSGNIETEESNTLLDEMLEKQQTSGVVEIPVLTINNRYHTDKPSAHFLFLELCSHFWEASMLSPYSREERVHWSLPPVCDACGSCPNVVGCMEYGHCVPWSMNGKKDSPSKQNGNKKGGHGWTITFLLVAAMAAGGAFFYYKRREHLGESGGGLLDGYMQLSGGST